MPADIMACSGSIACHTASWPASWYEHVVMCMQRIRLLSIFPSARLSAESHRVWLQSDVHLGLWFAGVLLGRHKQVQAAWLQRGGVCSASVTDLTQSGGCAHLCIDAAGNTFVWLGRVSFRGTFCITFPLGGSECPYRTVQHIAWRSTSQHLLFWCKACGLKMHGLYTVLPCVRADASPAGLSALALFLADTECVCCAARLEHSSASQCTHACS